MSYKLPFADTNAPITLASTVTDDVHTPTVNIGATALPAGAATAAKQPAPGAATAPSADVISIQPPAVTQVMDTALAASKVLKASAGQLCSLTVFNSGAAQFILVMNSTTVPANGAVALLLPPIPIAAASIVQIDFPRPVVASIGISVSNSSTGTFTKTIGSADCVFFAQVN